MKTTAVRLYGTRDLRLEEFDLPEMKDDEIIAEVITDGVCMSTYKTVEQGASHKRVPDDVAEHPIIVGHELCGRILEVGRQWQDTFTSGDRFALQPSLNYKGSLDSPGYSYQYIGGSATRIIIPREVMEAGCLLPYHGDSFFLGSLAEPLSCIIGAYRAMYHTGKGKVHEMGIKDQGKLAIMGGAGPMGLAAIDYALHSESSRPSLIVVTDIDQDKLNRASQCFPPEEAEAAGIELVYLNTQEIDDPARAVIGMTGGSGFDDVLVMAPVIQLVEQADNILGEDGCLNFFAGPSQADFLAKVNFYNIHYLGHHLIGTSGANAEDMKEAMHLIEQGLVNPACMITHVGGLTSVVDTVLSLPSIPGGKKLIYNHLDMPLVAIEDFASLGKEEKLYADLHAIVGKKRGMWCAEAEAYLLDHGTSLQRD